MLLSLQSHPLHFIPAWRNPWQVVRKHFYSQYWTWGKRHLKKNTEPGWKDHGLNCQVPKVGTVPSLLNCGTFLRRTILQHMDQGLVFALRAVGCHSSHPHRDILISPQRGYLCPPCWAGAVLALGRLARSTWHCLGEGGLAAAMAPWGAHQWLYRSGHPMTMLEAVFALLLQIQSKSSVLTSDEDDQIGLENLDSASHHPSF